MDTTNAPQMIEHLSNSLQFTPYEVKWIPQTAKFVLCGMHPKATGTMQIHKISKTGMTVERDIQHAQGVKCATFGASLSNKADMAFGDFKGELNIVDLETGKIYYSVKAHETLINQIDAVGGLDIGNGAPEIVTSGRDGCVRVWDPRQKSPVVSLEPIKEKGSEGQEVVPDAWCCAFGNSYNNNERYIAAGYDNGDLKYFDLKTNSLAWETNLQNGVCGLEFDRKDIIMNKLVATTLEGKYHMFDLRTQHPESGYAMLKEQAFKNGTIWGVKHLPQNRDIFLLQGSGQVNLYKYHYPNERSVKDQDGRSRGVVGKVELLNQSEICQQPVCSFDWNKDKMGLGVLCGFDQTVKVMLTTKLNLQ